MAVTQGTIDGLLFFTGDRKDMGQGWPRPKIWSRHLMIDWIFMLESRVMISIILTKSHKKSQKVQSTPSIILSFTSPSACSWSWNMPQFNDAVGGKDAHGTVQIFEKIFIKMVNLSSEWQLEVRNACVRGFCLLTFKSAGRSQAPRNSMIGVCRRDARRKKFWETM